MSNIIEELFYGNLEPQELTTEITPRLKKKLSELVKKEEELTSKLSEAEKELFSNYTCDIMNFQVSVILTVLFQGSGLARDLHMILL